MLLSKFEHLRRTNSPAVGYEIPTLSDDPADNLTDIYVSLDVWAAGVVSFVGVDGVTYTTPSISGSMLPYRIDVAIKRVWSTGTTVAASDLRGLK